MIMKMILETLGNEELNLLNLFAIAPKTMTTINLKVLLLIEMVKEKQNSKIMRAFRLVSKT